MALSHLAKNRISGLNQNTVESQACALHYNFAIDVVLRDHNWAFARKYLALPIKADEKFINWAYVYAYPPDCVSARRIVNPAADPGSESAPLDEIPWKLALASDNNTNVILCNLVDATLEYTARVQNAALFDASFCEALSWKLAAGMCALLRGGDATLLQFLRSNYTVTLSGARTDSANEAKTAPTTRSSLYDSR